MAFDFKSKGVFQLKLILGVAFLYSITGYFGLFISTEEFKYATAIWIPSGIALGAILVWGPRVLPGVFLGSLLINFYLSKPDQSVLFSLGIGSIIALGASLQAFIGYYLIKKFIGQNNPLNRTNDILLFALFSGPGSCLVNATFSNTLLFLLNLLPAQNFIMSWWTWYVGDTIGSLVFTPVILILFSKPYPLWRARVIPILVPLCLSFFLLGLIYIFFKNNILGTNQLWFILTTNLLFCVLIMITAFLISGQKNLIQSKLNEILRSAGEGIYVVDLQGVFTYVNPALEKMWGYPQESLIGKNIHDTEFHSHYCTWTENKLCPIFNAIKNNCLLQANDEIFIRKDGSHFWLGYTCSPLIIDNKTTGAVIVVKDIDTHRRAAFELEKLAKYDSLTNLPNRAAFFKTLAAAIKNFPQPDNSLLAVCFLDLDNFKQINDTLGHLIGDETLIKIAQILRQTLGMEYIARLGGDEFAIILENVPTQEKIHLLMRRLIQSIDKPLKINQYEIHVSVSVGIAIFPYGGKTGIDLLKNADIAMYHAKANGKRTYAFFDEEMTASINRIHQIDVKIRQALQKKELSLNYQFQVNNSDKQIFGIEALLRWHNSSLGGDVSPGEFIPIIEKNGLIHEIGEWIIRKAIYDYMEITKKFSQKITLSINVSVIQFEKESFFEALKQIIAETQISPELIYLEITESALMKNPEKTIKMMRAIKKLGVQFALDDFGIEYSSMQYLKNLPISQLKIDASFVRGIVNNENAIAIIKAIIQLASDLKITTIAEGIETIEQFQLLKDLKCNFSQGFYFYKPMSCDEILNRHKEILVE